MTVHHRVLPEYLDLLALSARLGRDPLRTQAAGGNTSLKRDGILWVKASGTWLAEAEDRDIMVPVDIEPLLAALAAGDPRAEKAIDFISLLFRARDSTLRPSVETSVHAVIPAAVVVHIHCVATVAQAVRQDARQTIAARLNGLPDVDWLFVPYVKPGVPLANVISARLRPTTNVIILGNHGLIVAADTVAEASALADRVAAALDTPRRPSRTPDLAALAEFARASPYRLPADPLAHDTAIDPASLAIAKGGTLYPDHVVFLGRGITLLSEGETPAAIGEREDAPLMLVVPGQGVLLHERALRGADELARGLAEVTARIATGTLVQYLTREREDELLQWDAELYRQRLAGEARKAATGA